MAGTAEDKVLRFDGNVPSEPPPTARVEVVGNELRRINEYPHGGYALIHEAIAEYAGVEPSNVVLGAGADDLLMLCGRAFAGPGDVVAVAYEPTYPVFRMAAWAAGAEVGDRSPVVTFCCRPHNPTGALVDLPAARPLVVDEAYFEYTGGETAAGLLDDGVVVVRTFSKAFGLAAARIGYALADTETATGLRDRQHPAPVGTMSVALALAGLADPPDVTPTLNERERLVEELRAIGLDPLPSAANFVYVPTERGRDLSAGLLRHGLPVRGSPNGIRITVRDQHDDDVLVAALADLLGAEGASG